ncbi:hypothetical protein COO09_20475 [Rhizorhabdus dicambivorans]|uniref:Uncharacterized protein n=1 Tax=Rhizorhabdus dicambivorans TaxID=1850238 RepID=A0A2A4FQG2_9SPHN|nr:hypothetical protein CMV14_19970 [Rhizorhabdus dicambivorans]PCE40359.1 hypothetical protein COO09_20475 [Rhizorhabdus dicambivorans]
MESGSIINIFLDAGRKGMIGQMAVDAVRMRPSACPAAIFQRGVIGKRRLPCVFMIVLNDR